MKLVAALLGKDGTNLDDLDHMDGKFEFSKAEIKIKVWTILIVLLQNIFTPLIWSLSTHWF